MVESEFAFSTAIKQMDAIKNLEIRCAKKEIEISGVLVVNEIKTVEENVIRISGRFGEINIDSANLEVK